MRSLVFQDVRCFSERHSVPIRPLTLLEAENSNGKTTFLSLAKTASERNFGRPPDFNENPFNLGSYEQIATFRGGRAGRAAQFTIGPVLNQSPRRRRRQSQPRLIEMAPEQKDVHLEAPFVPWNAQPRMSRLELASPDYGTALEDPEDENPTVRVRTPQGENIHAQEDGAPAFAGSYVDWRWLQLSRSGRLGRREPVLAPQD